MQELEVTLQFFDDGQIFQQLKAHLRGLQSIARYIPCDCHLSQGGIRSIIAIAPSPPIYGLLAGPERHCCLANPMTAKPNGLEAD